MGRSATLLFADNKLFHGLSGEALERASRLPDRVDAAAGDLLMEEGEAPRYLYLIAEGSVQISKRGRGGQQETLTFLNPGDFFGEMSLLDRSLTSARATACQDMQLGRIDSAGLDELLALAPAQLCRNMMVAMIARLRLLDRRFIDQMLEAERLSTVGSMVGSIIHDLKNPIGVVRGAAEIIADSTTDPTHLRMLAMVDRSARRMLDMAQDVLDFARGSTHLQVQRVRIREILDELEEQALAPARAQGIAVAVRTEYDGPLSVDRGKFVRVLLNIVKNAIEAMPDGGSLGLAIERRKSHVVFVVTDTGHGIDPEVLPRIFEPFVTHGKAGGTGLGMAIARSIVEAHGGRISVRSRPGAGTTFEIEVAATAELSTPPAGAPGHAGRSA
ncbi:MAG: ATP-binding protein [Longimicrobiales bacterium]